MIENGNHIVVVDNQIPLVTDVLRLHGIECVTAPVITNALLHQTHATAIIVRSTTHVTYDLLRGTHVSFVGSATAGMDHIEHDLLCDRNIRVIGAPGCNANAVAEYVVTWLSQLHVSQEARIGIIGFGNVGQRLARYAAARGHSVLINDPPLADTDYAFPVSVSPVSLDELLAVSDVVSLHAPYTRTGPYATYRLLCAERIKLLRKNSLLINTARGGIIDEQALVKRLRSHEIQCILDVFESEPDISFETVEAVVHCTPHIAGYTQTAKQQGARMVLEAFRTHSALAFEVPALADMATLQTSPVEDAAIMLKHPFRGAWLQSPTPQTFETCRRLTPLRTEHMQPPTWEELHGNHT